jgi:hypothetical protein
MSVANAEDIQYAIGDNVNKPPKRPLTAACAKAVTA